MVAWLVSEDPQQLVRVDSIVSVAAVPVNETGDPDWMKTHPRTRLRRARRVHIMVGTAAGLQVRAYTCRGGVAEAALDKLMVVLADLATKGGNQPAYVHAPRRGWSSAPQVWKVTDKIPDLDWDPEP